MNTKHLEKLAEAIFKSEQPFWGSWEKQDASIRLVYFDKAQDIVDLITTAGFELLERNETERSGSTPDGKQESK